MRFFAVCFVVSLIGALAVEAQVQVNGYYRSDGTYVRPHVRSAPGGVKWNNYGPSEYYGQSPYTRDADSDGLPNFPDMDDDNDGISDDAE